MTTSRTSDVTTPASAPRGNVLAATRATRVRGAVLGAAIGDALAAPAESIKSFAEIRAKFGPRGIAKYERYVVRAKRRVAPYTDDTQLAEITLRALVWGRLQGADLDTTMAQLGRQYVVWAYQPQGGHRAPESACLQGARSLATGTPWDQAGAPAANGSGSVVRAHTFGVMFADELDRAEQWAAEHSKTTHRATSALAACAAMARGTAAVVQSLAPSEVLDAMTVAAARYDHETARILEHARQEAVAGVEPDHTLQQLLGWSGSEAVAAAAYVFLRHADDFRAGVLEAANTPGDSDAIASLSGALIGARVGFEGLPEDWVRELERSDALLELADEVTA